MGSPLLHQNAYGGMLPKAAEASAEAVSLTQSGSEAGEAIFYTPGSDVQEMIEAIAALSPGNKALIRGRAEIRVK